MLNTTLCYIEQDGKYLMLFRNKKKNDINEGKWVGIGGKFEPGETDDQCLLREVFEETGLTLTEYQKRGIVDFSLDKGFSERMHLYTATGFTGTLTEECNEGELRWVEKEKVSELPRWEGDKIFMKKLLDGESDFYLRLDYEGDKLVNVVME
ncbi:MAG: 8-oxo-dGTP diphosphatase [Lachnospiraceae bacterium]|nr:8-oxo-dGTP diphosphatase [Lachnospiraceae bacterium]